MSKPLRTWLDCIEADPKGDSLYTYGDSHIDHLRKINEWLGTYVMNPVFCLGTSQRPTDVSLLDYYKSKKVSVSSFRRSLDNEELQMVMQDPEGKTFNASLLYKCILWGNDQVADRKDPKWQEDQSNLESLLTTFKTKREAYLNIDTIDDAEEFKNAVEEMGDLSLAIIKSSGARYRIPQMKVDGDILIMNAMLMKQLHHSYVPFSFDEYQRLNSFSENVRHIRKYRKVELEPLYQKLLSVSPLPMRADFAIQVEDMYSELVMVLESTKGLDKVEYSMRFEDIFKDIKMDFTSPAILLVGLPGAGKTFLTRKILGDWMAGRKTIKNLQRYDFVLYTQGSNTEIKSFEELLKALMPELGRVFEDDKFSRAILSTNVLVIIDGLDQWTSASHQLFKDVIHIKSTHDLTVLITSRPIGMNCYYSCTIDRYVKTKHIKVVGVSQENCEKYVTRYHKEMLKTRACKQSLRNLIIFFKNMRFHVGDLLQLPLILTFCTVLWFDKPQVLNNCTSYPELYLEIQELILGALLDRLRNLKELASFDDGALKQQINGFLTKLYKKALLTVREHILHVYSAYELTQFCFRDEIGSEDLLSTFFQKPPSFFSHGMREYYTFHFEGFRDFLGAYGIFMKLIDTIAFQNDTVKSALGEEIMVLNLPFFLKERLLKELTEKMELDNEVTSAEVSQEIPLQETTLVRRLLENVLSNVPFDLRKYQNVLVLLLGMLHKERYNIYNGYKLEVMNLIEETGLCSSEDWLRVLAAVRCDAFVASHISEKYGLLKGNIEIFDSTMLAYIYLLNALKPPVKGQREISLEINSKRQTPYIGELLKLLNLHQMRIEKILITDENVIEYMCALKDIKLTLLEPHPLTIDVRIMENRASIIEFFNVFCKHKISIERILITDENTVRYISLLKASKPVINFEGVNIVVDIQRGTSETIEMLTYININKLNVKSLSLRQEFFQPNIYSKLDCAVNQTFCTSSVEKYEGKVNANMVFPLSLKALYVNVPNTSSYTALHQFFHSNPRLTQLGVCVTLRLYSSNLHPLPCPSIHPPSLYLPDVNHEDEIHKAAQIAKKLQPIEGDKQFYHIYFPRSNMSHRKVKKVIKEFSGLSVSWCLVFPPSCKPTSPEEEADLIKLAKKELNCEGSGIEWAEYYGLDNWK